MTQQRKSEELVSTTRGEDVTRWLFAYGPSTDLERMTREIGGWTEFHTATLDGYVYTFAGVHPTFGGGASNLRPLPGGCVLGIAYLVEERRLKGILEDTRHRALHTHSVVVDGKRVEAFALHLKGEHSLTPPSEQYLESVRIGLCQHYPEEIVDLYLERAVERTSGQDLIAKASPTQDSFNFEYGCQFRRLFPWTVTRQRPFGSAWAVVAPGDCTTPHSHDEEEAFIFVAGEGQMTVEAQEFPVSEGDAIYLKPFSAHTVRNSGRVPLQLLCIWWGGAPPEEAETESAAMHATS